MRRYITIFAGVVFLIFGVAAVAQTYGSGQSNNGPNLSNTQTTTTQSTTTTTNAGTTVEGCLVKEQSDFFLIPRSGSPIKLQPTGGENLGEHEGHQVSVSGNEMQLSSTSAANNGLGASGAMAGTSGGSSAATGTNPSGGTAVAAPSGSSAMGSTGTATGTGNDLHKLATEELIVTNLRHIAASCPVNWNPNVPAPSNTSGATSNPY
jgi:hypothetical protein